jgi:hypothetical protein
MKSRIDWPCDASHEHENETTYAVSPLGPDCGHRVVSSAYGNSIVLLLLSGFMVSRLLEDSGVCANSWMAIIHTSLTR